MRKIRTLTAAALLLVCTAAMAQQPGEGPMMRSATERAVRQTTELVESLGLNADQTAKIQSVNMKYAAKDSITFAGMRSQSPETMDRDAMMKTMQEQRAAKSVEIEAVLTDAQKVKYEAAEKERQSQGPQGGPQ
jgi:periplasmic protein CpxP/Spy